MLTCHCALSAAHSAAPPLGERVWSCEGVAGQEETGVGPSWCGPASSAGARLQERIVGQTEAVRALARAMWRARTGLKDPRRPIAAMLFAGGTGVGKTETTKARARGLPPHLPHFHPGWQAGRACRALARRPSAALRSQIGGRACRVLSEGRTLAAGDSQREPHAGRARPAGGGRAARALSAAGRGAGAGGAVLWQRAAALRHERVHGAPLGGQAGRRAARLRRLQRGRQADRGNPARARAPLAAARCRLRMLACGRTQTGPGYEDACALQRACCPVAALAGVLAWQGRRRPQRSALGAGADVHSVACAREAGKAHANMGARPVACTLRPSSA